MQLLYQIKLYIIQKNRSWFQQNFLKFDKNLYKNPKIRSYFQLKITQMQLLYQKNLT